MAPYRYGFLSTIFIIGFLFILSCHHAPAHFSPDYGKSYRALFSRQVVNTGAPSNPEPVVTLPGAVGSDIYKKRYIKSLTEDKKEKKESVGRQLRDLD